jgi:hypothetical protein
LLVDVGHHGGFHYRSLNCFPANLKTFSGCEPTYLMAHIKST